MKDVSRRDFLKLAGYGTAALSLYGLWRLSYEVERGEKSKQLNEWEPQVANYLFETIESNKLDNLKVFTEIARPQFIDLVARNTKSLLSSSTEAYASRYNLLAFALGEHYGVRIATHEEGQVIPFDEDTLSFLDRSLTRVGLSRISEKSIEKQANMWIEGLYRSYAAAWQLDPTMPEGVYLPENQSLFGHVFVPNNRFVRLQPHS